MTQFLPEKQETDIDISQISVNMEQVLKGLGMKRGDADGYLLDLINSLTIQCLKLARPKAGFSYFLQPEFDVRNNLLLLQGHHFFLGKTVTQMLKKSEAVVLFAVTIGHGVEVFSKKQINEGNILEGYIVDLLGSELAEGATDFLHNYIEGQMEMQGLGLSNRYSPGYCNWPVSDQHQLFDLLDGVNCGITLNPSALMLPVKSVSGIMGVGNGLKRVDYKCRLCDDEKCILRRNS